MLPPTCKEVVAEKDNEIETAARLAMRSLSAIDKETNVTRVNMAPDDTAALGNASAEVST